MGGVTARIDTSMDFYNHRRKHQSLDYETPWNHYLPGSNKTGRETLTQQKFPPRGTEARAALKGFAFSGTPPYPQNNLPPAASIKTLCNWLRFETHFKGT